MGRSLEWRPKNMTKQELAKQIDQLDWEAIQGDDQYANDTAKYLVDELLKLTSKEAIVLLFAVIEAKSLPDDFMGEDRIMHRFENL